MAEQFIGSTNGVTLRVRMLAEPPDAIVAVLFAHATGFCAEVWDPMAREPALSHVAAASLDFRAHGSSTRPVDGNFDWIGMADDVLCAVEHLDRSRPGAPSLLVGAGHSMGGAALLLAEQRRPGTFAGLWCYEPVVFPPEGTSLSGGDPGGDNPMSVAAARRRPDFAPRDAAVENYAAKPPLDVFRRDAIEAYVAGGFRELDDGSVTLCCRPEDEADVFRMAAHHQAWDGLASMRCPVRIIRGLTGPPGPGSFAAQIVDRLRHGQLEDHAGLGHFGPMEDPVTMAASLAALISTVTPPE